MSLKIRMFVSSCWLAQTAVPQVAANCELPFFEPLMIGKLSCLLGAVCGLCFRTTGPELKLDQFESTVSRQPFAALSPFWLSRLVVRSLSRA